MIARIRFATNFHFALFFVKTCDGHLLKKKWGYNKIYIPIHTLYIPYIPYIPNNKIYIPQPNSSYSHYIPHNKIYIPTTYLE